ncbi:MAG TPA: prepilin-type N-terminal cleavage/methylation domain-containing protein [Patescibacteria group bacterium]|nr:prepilin-type N-terminal cleavage/methylation domain-containing protein [Patescibacteria group bacterium]
MMSKRTTNSGFTLIEVLITVAIIAVLATIVYVSLNPVQRFADARNSHRWIDVDSIITAIHEYIVDNAGTLPAGIDTTEKQLGTCGSGGATACSGAADACLDLSSLLVTYLKTMPVDPSNGTASATKYSVVANANNIITVKACAAENGTVIEVSR